MIIFDIEANGLPHNVTTIHCVALYDTETGETHSYNDSGGQPITTALTLIEDADVIIGHNIINYDLRVIKKIYGFFEPRGEVIDTLLLSKLYHPDMMETDKKMKWKDLPTKLYGRHSLKSYGYRFGVFKGDFGDDADWSEWSQEMEDYCRQDVKVTTLVWHHFEKKLMTENTK